MFSATVQCKELRFFALQSVRPGASFELFKHLHTMIFIFWLIMGFAIFQTPGRGIKINFQHYFQFYYGKRHLKPWAPETYPLY